MRCRRRHRCADCLDRQFGQRPLIFYSNAYEHWLWDDTRYPPRAVQGFYKKAELDLAIQRRSTRRPLAAGEINPAIVERHDQTRGIGRIAEAFERDHDRKALLVLHLQLAMPRSEARFARLRQQVRELAGLLAEKEAIPMVRDQMALIQDVQTDEW